MHSCRPVIGVEQLSSGWPGRTQSLLFGNYRAVDAGVTGQKGTWLKLARGLAAARAEVVSHTVPLPTVREVPSNCRLVSLMSFATASVFATTCCQCGSKTPFSMHTSGGTHPGAAIYRCRCLQEDVTRASFVCANTARGAGLAMLQACIRRVRRPRCYIRGRRS